MTEQQFKDYYSVLGIERSADTAAIRKAYRRLARQYHPDVNKDNPEAAEKFREISEAYEVLGDDEKRKIYDKYGEKYKEYESWKRAGGEATGVPFDAYMSRQSGGFGAAGNPFSGGEGYYRTVNPEDLQDMFGDDSPFSDFFYSMFGGQAGAGAPRANRPAAGRDMEYPVNVTLEEAFSGTKRVLEMPTGDPAKPTRRIEITIPAGVSDGGRVRLAGLGSAGRNGGRPGDLYLLVSVEPHPFFERKGNDLYAKINVPLTNMLLGGEVSVPTIKGTRLALRIPGNSANNAQMRLRGQGMPVRAGSDERGDLYVTLQTQLPTDLNDEERAALENFAKLLDQRSKAGD
jgi:DnaJ-class molecular chaperone